MLWSLRPLEIVLEIVYRRQILTSKVDYRAVRVKFYNVELQGLIDLWLSR